MGRGENRIAETGSRKEAHLVDQLTPPDNAIWSLQMRGSDGKLYEVTLAIDTSRPFEFYAPILKAMFASAKEISPPVPPSALRLPPS